MDRETALEIHELHARLCKAIADPKRLLIINELRDGPLTVGELAEALEIGQPISHRIDHMLSGVRSQIAIKIFGEDLDALRGQADPLRAKLAAIPGMADLQIEKQVLAPQIKAWLDANMPEIVEKLAREEIKRLTGKL